MTGPARHLTAGTCQRLTGPGTREALTSPARPRVGARTPTPPAVLPQNEVSYQNLNFRAKWWTQNNVPGADQWGPWESLGACGDTPTEEPKEERTEEPTEEPTGPASGNLDEKCRLDGMAQTPGVDTPYCDVYDEAGREKLPNGLDRRVIGYFTSWRTGQNGQPRYHASDIPWQKVSHINDAFAHIGISTNVRAR